jgi:hypothetical protein
VTWSHLKKHGLTVADYKALGYGKTFSHTEEARRKIAENNARYWQGKKRPGLGEKLSKIHTGRYRGSPCDNSVEQNLRERKSAAMKKWARAVKRRDGYKCMVCFSAEQPLIAHHIWPFHGYTGIRFALDNGITLCEPCHHKTLGRELDFVNQFGWRLGLPVTGYQTIFDPDCDVWGRSGARTDQEIHQEYL